MSSATFTETALESKSDVGHLTLRSSPLSCLNHGIPLDPLPENLGRDPAVPHSPPRPVILNDEERTLALSNALRYFPKHLHTTLAPEFAEELRQFGHIYMYRFRPTEYEMRAHPIDHYPAKCRQAAAVMLMIQNNLDQRVAQFPHELVTYGGNGSVFQNWAQYHLVMRYLSEMEEDQTLVMYSGHPLGLFPSHRDAPRVVVTNGMMVPNYSSGSLYEKLYALGVTQYGQMTAGSYCYIGPQGIVHGTTITVLNAGRKYLGTSDLRGKVYVSSGLGGMSGAQPKAAVICGTIGVVAEVDEAPLRKRYEQGWVQEMITDMDELVERLKETVSIGFHGNVVSLWERLAEEEELLVELGSDQTSLHNPYGGGYFPVQLSLEEARRVMVDDPERFKELVHESLRRHVAAINRLVERGMRWWDYGNSLLLQASRAGADIFKPGRSPAERAAAEGVPESAVAPSKDDFRYPSYVQDIMGDIFSLGFGPFRWVCTSNDADDLRTTDEIAAAELRRMMERAPPRVHEQLEDNLMWITKAEENKMVVGSQARILYADCEGRAAIALAFNAAIKDGRLKAPVVLSRDHHDVSGTDSPFRETSNVADGSAFCADMAVQNCIGDACRGATWVALHNGGGVGWGEVMNGGFGLVLDGTDDAARRARMMLHWDVNNGVARRAWAHNSNARFAIERAMEIDPKLKVTLAEAADADVVAAALGAAGK